jgi:chaperonin cofactor prefoldin
MSPRKSSRLSASHAQLQETVEALKKSLKALESTRMASSSGILELKQAIRDAIGRAEKIGEEDSERQSGGA